MPTLNEVVFKLLAETLISIGIFYMLKSMKLLPVKSLGLLLYNPMNKESKYTSHKKLMAKNTCKLAHEHAGRCKLLLIQEKLDGTAAESCKSG